MVGSWDFGAGRRCSGDSVRQSNSKRKRDGSLLIDPSLFLVTRWISTMITVRCPETEMVGAGGKEVWTFKGVRPGETTVELEYVRPWEAGVEPVVGQRQDSK